MSKKIFLFLILYSSMSLAFAQTWRSTLYPTDWMPGFKDALGRFFHDFSYAGYRSGVLPLPEITTKVIDVTLSPYFADKTGATDTRAIIQQALNDVGKAGGGVVFLPEGTYKINVSSVTKNSIKINYSNTILRGAGPDKTFIFNENPNVRLTNIIYVLPLNGGDWVYSGTNTVNITSDLLQPTQVIPVSSVSGFSVGDWVIIRSDCTTSFIEEHQMGEMWGTAMVGPIFYRVIEAIDVAANTIKVDAPTRYFLKMRDNARVYKVVPVLKEVGLENFSISNKQSALSGMAENDYDVPGTGAYEIHGTNLIAISSAINCWIKNIQTYKPVQNTSDFHLVSNGILLNRSRFVTVESCYFQKPQYEGGGGNGYMYIMGGNDCLVKNSRANHARHNYDFKSMQSNGNVILRCRGENSSLSSDFHMHLSMSNLFDNFTANKDNLEAKFRPYGTSPAMHGHPTTQSVFWNTTGEAYQAGKTSIVESAQYGWGYIIGTRGVASAVKTSPFLGTTSNYAYDSSPEDYKEGIGKGDLLEPESLYEDQLRKRIARNSVEATREIPVGVSGRVTIYPNPSNSGNFNIESSYPIDRYKLLNLTGQVIAENQQCQKKGFELDIARKGIYILMMDISGQTITKKLVIN